MYGTCSTWNCRFIRGMSVVSWYGLACSYVQLTRLDVCSAGVAGSMTGVEWVGQSGRSWDWTVGRLGREAESGESRIMPIRRFIANASQSLILTPGQQPETPPAAQRCLQHYAFQPMLVFLQWITEKPRRISKKKTSQLSYINMNKNWSDFLIKSKINSNNSHSPVLYKDY